MNSVVWSIGHEIKIPDIVKADNVTLYDSKGNKYMDLESGVWCTSIGHSNKKLVDTIKNQLDKIMHTGFCYCNSVIDETAKKILDIANLTEGKCEYFCSGSEAVEYAVRVARTISKKPKALRFTDSYFGAYGDATIKNCDTWYDFDWINCSCEHESGKCIGTCKEFNEIPFEEIGIFAFEPGSSSGLVRFPGNELIEKISKKIRENYGIIISNEITTGIGRTGEWFGFMHYSIKPDIIAIGKGVGNGYPVSVTALSKRIVDELKKHEFYYGQSHQNDPLGASVAGKVIDIITEEKLVERGEELGNYFYERLSELKANHSNIKEIRSKGLMIAIEFESNMNDVYNRLIEKGFIITKRFNAEVIRLDPAITIEKENIDSFISTLEFILSE